jgi:hypothetical protein
MTIAYRSVAIWVAAVRQSVVVGSTTRPMFCLVLPGLTLTADPS